MKKKHVLAAAVILMLLAGIGWALFSGEDAKVAEAKKMRDEMFQNIENIPPEERRAQFELLREKTRDLTESQRREFGQGMRQFMLQRVDRLLALPPAEQRAELDKWIDRMEDRNKNREAGGGRGDRGRGGDMSSAERDQRRKERLDRSSPMMRAKMDTMKDLINERREERGLEPIEGPGGMFGRGRGGPR